MKQTQHKPNTWADEAKHLRNEVVNLRVINKKLLEALEDMVGWIATSLEDDEDNPFLENVQTARAAIKATTEG